MFEGVPLLTIGIAITIFVHRRLAENAFVSEPQAFRGPICHQGRS
jgi:hypothetical protein